MARHPQPRHITLGGREAIALTPEEYEQLIASRRQIGGQSARVRVLGQQAKRTEQLLNDLERLIAAPPDACRERDGGVPGACLRTCGGSVATEPDTCNTDAITAIAELLRRHRDPAS
ncbi:hypothetical protein ABZ471_46030 [Streptomyces sp. NPDC005728]|uniref:hypothetical protein n=1 Tax=Streptomyces sp. NPDC005728 TaxID=3157054 RepID=UPI0033D3A2E1